METEIQAAGDARADRIAPKNWVPALSKALGKHKFFGWLVYGSVIGALSGLMAGLVFFCLEWAKFFVLEYLAGYEMAKPAGEHLVPFVTTTPLHLWLLVLLPCNRRASFRSDCLYLGPGSRGAWNRCFHRRLS